MTPENLLFAVAMQNILQRNALLHAQRLKLLPFIDRPQRGDQAGA
ncbi:hypothetical protein [Acetobacter thailandicus]|uniref:Transposase n=1 Tax=Acetobacter thailandicus TaxID=1502842 RepID=A0ABT3QDW9_9PROT|nr:hypothetical protein [Acetobacter thailandicus]MCX2563465.1 hypothetical protein [Acetobacter thailandicus]